MTTCVVGKVLSTPDDRHREPSLVSYFIEVWIGKNYVRTESGDMESDLHGARFSKINPQISFRKILKTIIVVDDILIHHFDKFQDQIFCILTWRKKTNLHI